VPPKRRVLTRGELKALEKFARLEISLDDLKVALRKILQFEFKDNERRLTSHFVLPQPGVRIDEEDIRRAMNRHTREEISTSQLADWATMLLLNDAYDWQGTKEEEIATWLNEISMLTLKSASIQSKDETS
jgi:hypothetical protein